MKKTQLQKAYSKQLKSLSKDFFENPAASSKIFILYLKYLRDSKTIQIANINQDENILILNAAIAEFDAFVKYPDSEQADFHLQNFCELLKSNLKEWLN